MSEDLYKKEKKPYVEQTEAEGKSDEQASYEQWNKHILRNESIICDLFHGQFKSTLQCSICERISITFDPFLMVSVPVPNTKWEEIEGYFMKYDLDENYQNYKFKVKMRDSDQIYDLRKKMEEAYGFKHSTFIITWVCDNTIHTIFNSTMTIKELKSSNNN
jgi:hypothetical protein